MKIFQSVLALVLFAVVARAGDAANLDFIGFSKDGRYLAFEQFGSHDGSGFPYASLTVVDVAKNTVLAQTNQTIEKESATVPQARAALQSQRRANMQRYSIVAGNQGRFIGIAPSAPNIQGQRSQFVYGGKTYQLELNSVFADVDEKTCPDKIESRLELTLTVAGKTRSLQKDSQLPKSRACALSYEMRSAHLFGSSLVVFVAVQTPGFEGADLRFMAVTTKV